MSKFLIQVAAILSLLCVGSAFAQQVAYRVTSIESINISPTVPFNINGYTEKEVGEMIINYRPDGYDAIIDGMKLTLNFTHSQATIKMNDFVLVFPIDGPYYLKDVGARRKSTIATSFGDKGYVEMTHLGFIKGGRKYVEKTWLNGELISDTSTVIDSNNQIVWSVSTTSEEVITLKRIGD